MTCNVMLRQRGISQLEFAVVVTIICVLAAFLLNSLLDVQGEAERAEVEATVSNIRSGIRMAVHERTVRGQGGNFAELLTRNPIEFLGSPPRGYVGEGNDTSSTGVWRFDPKTHILAYRTRHPDVFDGQDELRWRITLQDGSGGQLAGVQLESAL